ncbi:thioesterase II family protein [Actinoplanes sp. N902-109]|uniref:thioesterase II family protein n=1 Tax=Actinoplanes sp. (strain N902-109) TaxID=649831 RepID=UPI0003294F9D|nr:alpha/beta fold hydrolase [Actinoplanes sp. N902-109]AGL15969.1 oleoyl-ACP hydrolase [Actinoplanes sp. N902-109]
MSTGTAVRSPYLTRDPDPTAALRLFCFHHAGGAASAFNGWAQALGPRISVVPVQLPGRETRIREPRLRDMTAVVEALAAQLGPWLSRPYAFYGHSMGALLAYNVARLRAAAGRPAPYRLVVSAFPAPHLPSATVPVGDLSDDGLIRWMTGIGGMSGELAGFPQWQRTVAAVVRDDLAVCASHRHVDGAPLRCPIHVFTGTTDPLVTRADAQAWAQHTEAGFQLHEMAGGHFFPRETGRSFLDRLAASLDAGTAL